LYKIINILACMRFFSSLKMNYSLTKQFYLKLLSCFAVSSLTHSYSHPAIAQITPDTTLPINTTVRVNNNTNILEGGTRVEGNIFHSLREFSVINGSEAFFNNPLDIRNIITRVTGQSPSDINGTIRANGAANLFLINPSGIIFGENARLDIGGSFVGSTANSLLFNNGWEYSATNPNSPPLLTVSIPVGLQFGSNPGAIEVRGSGHELTYDPRRGTTIQDNVPALGVQAGKTFALVGGDIFFKGGNVYTESGKIFLGSVNSPNLVSLKVNDSDLAFEYSGVEKFGNIELSQKASVDVSGEGGGSIQIQGQKLSIRDGSSVLSITAGSQPGRDIIVNTTELVELIGESADGKYASSIFTQSQGAGSSGNLTVNTLILTATGGAYLSTYIGSSGNAGQLTVTAPQAIELSGRGIYSSGFDTGSSTFSSGSGGNLNIKTGRLSIKNGATVSSSTNGEGSAGELNIDTGNGRIEVTGTSRISTSSDDFIPSSIVAQSNSKTTGAAGNLTIKTGELIAQGGGFISTSTFGTAQAGNLTIDAISYVELSGIDTFSFQESGLFALQNSEGETGIGNAGNLTINTPLLRVLGGATVNASTSGAGRGGELNIDTGNGRIEVIGTSSLGFPRSSIVAQANLAVTGVAGNLTIKTGELIVQDGAYISAGTFGAGQSGNLTINASEKIEIVGVNPRFNGFPSGLFTQQDSEDESGTGNAGNLTISTPLLSVLNGATVSVSTFGDGQGGDLKITTDQLLVRKASIRARSLGAGNAGNLTINAKSAINLDDNAIVTANTRSNGVDQATITINSGDLILRRGSRITTNAIGTGVIGGDININTGNLALLERSNITANSTDARGGKINIQTQGLFQSPDSAITARGQTQELSGIVNITTTLDPSSALKEIPINLVDLSRQIASSCVPRTAQNRNSFTVTGRGGIPANSTELLHDTSTIAMWVRRKPKPQSEQSTMQQSSVQPNSIPQPIVEANDWRVDSRGHVHLVATNQASYVPSKANVCPN
jgi:filamentous hemagglutinin family protein